METEKIDSFDLKTPSYMVYCVIVACIGSFSNGWVIGSANIPGEVTHNCQQISTTTVYPKLFPDCLLMSTSVWGFAVGSFCLGGLVGGLAGGLLQTRYGRKKTIIFNNIGWIAGGVLIAASISPAMFIVGRVFCGLSCGLGSLTTPTYVGEISTIRSRGAMGTFNQVFIVTGILLASVIGLPLATVPLWRINYAIVIIPAILQFFLMAGCVESPRYLISINRIDEARTSLTKLRPNTNIERELYDMVKGQLGSAVAANVIMPQKEDGSISIDSIDSQQPQGPRKAMTILQIFVDPLIRRIAMTVLTLHVIQQLIGMSAVMYYSTAIFNTTFSSEISKCMAIVTTVVNFVATLISVSLIDRMGRRPLLLIAETGACIFSILLVIGYVYSKGALLVVSVFGYVFFFAIGVGPIPWMMTSELTPLYASSAVGAVGTAMNWAMNFLVAQAFPVVFAGIQGYSFTIFAGVSAFAMLFTFFRVPETKGRSLEQIVETF